jgi:hypothetical protein
MNIIPSTDWPGMWVIVEGENCLKDTGYGVGFSYGKHFTFESYQDALRMLQKIADGEVRLE